MTEKLSYVEPKDAPKGIPCRFCDLPSGTDGLGPVVQDGIAIDGERPLLSHRDCLMNAGGKKSDDQDFSLKSASVEEDNIWAFAGVNKFITPTPEDKVKSPKLAPDVRTDANNDEGTDDSGIESY